MNIRPIRSEDDLTWALAEVEPYFLSEPKKGSEDATRFEILADLIRGYEALHWSIEGTGSGTQADQRFVRRGVAYRSLASVRAAIKSEHIAKTVKRSGLMSASSGRLVVRPIPQVTRTRRSLKSG